jgi:hypothetical protein
MIFTNFESLWRPSGVIKSSPRAAQGVGCDA